jgi:hypothetical protein
VILVDLWLKFEEYECKDEKNGKVANTFIEYPQRQRDVHTSRLSNSTSIFGPFSNTNHLLPDYRCHKLRLESRERERISGTNVKSPEDDRDTIS